MQSMRDSVHLVKVLLLCAGLVTMGTPAAAQTLLGIELNGFSGVLYDIDTSTGAATNPRTVADKVTMIAVSPSGILYGASQGFPSDVPPGGGLYTITIASGAPTFVATMSELVVTEGDIAFDPTTGILYGLDGEGKLFTINTSTGVGTVIGDVSTSNIDLSAMAFDASGNLFVIESFGMDLLEINKSTAAITNTTSLTPVNQEIGGLAFRPGDGTLFYAAGSTSKLYTINTGSGNAPLVGSVTVTGGIWGLTFTPDPLPAHPATWGRVKSIYAPPPETEEE